MPDLGIGLPVNDADLRFGLGRTLWLQTLWMLLVGIVLVVAPVRRFGTAWYFITQVPGGDDILGAVFIIVSMFMGWALATGRQQALSRGLLAAGMTNWTLGIFLLMGTISGPTGVMGAPFCLYVGAHMLLVSVMITKRR